MAVPVVVGIIGGLGGLGLMAGWAVKRRRASAAAATAASSPEVPLEQPPAGAQPGEDLLGTAKGLLGGGPAGIAKAGLMLSDKLGDVLERLGAGAGKGNVVRVGGPGFVLPVLADLGAKKALGAVGVDDPGAQKTAGQLAAAGSVGGLAGLALVGGVKGVDGLLGVVSPGAQEAVHDLLRPFDPTNPNSAAGKFVGGIADMFGIGSKEKEPVLSEEEAKVVLEQAGVSTQQAIQAAVNQVGTGGLLDRAKAASTVPLQPPAPAVLPVVSPPVSVLTTAPVAVTSVLGKAGGFFGR